MTQKKLNQKKSQKEKKNDSRKENQSPIDTIAKKDENNNKIVIKNEFCKGNVHFVCSKFTDDQFNFIRENLIKIKENKELLEEIDLDYLDELLNNHHLITRYMMRYRHNQNEQLEFILKVLKWRKLNLISKIKKELFPREAIELVPMFPYKKTKKNEIVCYLRLCLYPHSQIDFMEQFSIYQLYVINKLAMDHNTTWVWFFDLTNATKSNIDIKASRNIIDILNTYYPYANTKSIVYNLPWYLSWLKALFFSFLPSSIKQLVSFYDSKNLHELIDPENLPPHLGGTGKLEDCELYREFSSCDNNMYLEEWIKNPPSIIKTFDPNANLDEICERSKLFLQKQIELIENLKKKGVII